MSEPRRTKLSEDEEPKVELRGEGGDLPAAAPTPEQAYLERKAAVNRQDHEEFLRYQKEKEAQERQRKEQAQAVAVSPRKVGRRNFVTVVAGTAAVGEAAVLGYSVVKDQIPAHGARHAGDTYTEAQRHNIERELINPRADIGGRGFGNWVLLMPTKLGGGTYAVSLNTGRCLSWITFWPYGDFNPISHHLCAFPSADPSAGFRVGQQHPRRQERADLRHPDKYRDAG